MAPWDHPGGPWGQQDGLEVVVSMLLVDFGVVLGPVYISFLISMSLTFHFVSGLFPGKFVFVIEISTLETSKIEVLARKVLQKSTFHGNRF